MTRLSPQALSRLADILFVCDELAGIVTGRTLEEFQQNTEFRWSVERALQIVGEAMAQALRADSDVLLTLPEARQIIGMRNWLIHGYRDIDHGMVWEAASLDAPGLANQVRLILDTGGTQ